MFFFDNVPLFHQTVQNRKSRKRNRADHCGNESSEKSSDYENRQTARRARHQSPQNTQKRRGEKHFAPRKFFERKERFADHLARKVTRYGADDIDECQQKNSTRFRRCAARKNCFAENRTGRK